MKVSKTGMYEYFVKTQNILQKRIEFAGIADKTEYLNDEM